MRLKFWWTPILGVMAIAFGGLPAQAQPDPFNTPPQRGGTFTSHVRPITSDAPAGPGAVEIPGFHSVANPGAKHADAATYMQPWPGLSLFENRYRRLQNSNGLWQMETNNSRRRYFAGLNAMFFQMQSPEQSLVGDTGAHRLLGAFPDGAAKTPDVDRDTVTIKSQFFVQNITGGTNFIGKRIFKFPFKTEGVRANWGFWDADDTGLETVAWWASDVFYEFALFEEFDPTNPPPFSPRGPVIPARLPNGAAVSLFFDGSFTLRYRQSAANAQITRMMRTIWESGPLRVRPMYGARYTLVREGMFFTGFDYSDTITLPFQTTLASETTSHLAGPEVGLLGTLGGDSFKVTIGSRFILYVNHERQRLNGNNFIDIFTRQTFGNQNLRFDQQRDSTHLSPAFEQTVHFEAKLFQYVPGLNRIRAIREAKLRGGLTYLDIGLIARPNKSVRYNAFPGAPRLQTKRSKFSLLAWDVGLSFDY